MLGMTNNGLYKVDVNSEFSAAVKTAKPDQWPLEGRFPGTGGRPQRSPQDRPGLAEERNLAQLRLQLEREPADSDTEGGSGQNVGRVVLA